MQVCTTTTQPSSVPSPTTTNRFHADAAAQIFYKSQARPALKMFLICLSTWVGFDGRGQCFPSNEQIRQRLNGALRPEEWISERTVQRYIEQARDTGELRVLVNGSVRGTNLFTILCLLPGYAPHAKKAKPQKAQGGDKPKPKVSPEVRNIPLPKSIPVPVSIPIPISISQEIQIQGEGSENISNLKQAAPLELPAVPPPVEVQVQKVGTDARAPLGDEERALAMKWFFRAVPREQWERRIPITREQVRLLESAISCRLMPWPAVGSRLDREMRRAR